jgi:hypothetical protein
MSRPARIVVGVLVLLHLMVDIEKAWERRDKEVSLSLPVSSATREFVVFAKHPTTSRYGQRGFESSRETRGTA